MKLISRDLPAALLVAVMVGATSSCALAPAAPGGASAPGVAAAPTTAPAPVRKPMFDTPLEGLNGLTGIMYVTDFLPGAVSTHHSHPGYEFNYILKGAVTFQVDG